MPDGWFLGSGFGFALQFQAELGPLLLFRDPFPLLPFDALAFFGGQHEKSLSAIIRLNSTAATRQQAQNREDLARNGR